MLFTERIHCIRMHIKLLLLLVLITYLYLLFQEDISNELLNDMESVLNVNKLDNILAGDNSLTWLWNRNKLHIPCCISESSVTWHKVMWPPVASVRGLLCTAKPMLHCLSESVIIFSIEKKILLEYQGKWEREIKELYFVLLSSLSIFIDHVLTFYCLCSMPFFFLMPVCIDL